jgi:hypothetical protein
MKELTNKQKLEVLKEVRENYNGHYLCSVIAEKARRKGCIEEDEYEHGFNYEIAQTLIPELLQFKPESMDISDSWFGSTHNTEAIAKRREVLEKLIEMISKKIERRQSNESGTNRSRRPQLPKFSPHENRRVP